MDRAILLHSPLALNYSNLDDYNPDWDIDTIMVFEKIILVAVHGRNRVFKLTNLSLEKRLRLGRRRVQKALSVLIEMKLILRVGTKQRAACLYRLDVYMLAKKLDQIYNLKQVPDAKVRADVRKRLRLFFYRKFGMVKHIPSLKETDEIA